MDCNLSVDCDRSLNWHWQWSKSDPVCGTSAAADTDPITPVSTLCHLRLNFKSLVVQTTEQRRFTSEKGQTMSKCPFNMCWKASTAPRQSIITLGISVALGPFVVMSSHSPSSSFHVSRHRHLSNKTNPFLTPLSFAMEDNHRQG